jgi:hypothetical protein
VIFPGEFISKASDCGPLKAIRDKISSGLPLDEMALCGDDKEKKIFKNQGFLAFES